MNILTSRITNPPKNRTLTILLALSTLAFILMAYVWWTQVHTTPENVFRGMIERNLRTSGYTRIISIEESDLTQTQFSQVQTGAEHIAFSRIDSVTTTGDKQVAEVIATPTEDFVRYLDLEYQDAEGNEVDTTNAENVWARQENSGDLSQSYAQLTLFRTYFPMGTMSSAERNKILQQIEQNTVYNVNYDEARRENIDGKDVYTYDVTVQLQAYTDMIKMFGNAIGQSDIVAGLDPAQSAGSEPVPLKVSVDIASRQLVQVTYSGSESISEKYSGFGIKTPISIPEEFITTLELQQRLSPGQ